MAMVPRAIEVFARRYFGITLMPFHKEGLWSAFEGGLLDVMWPTLHGKTTIFNLLFPIASLANNPDGAHILMGSNLDDSKSNLALIQQHLENNEALVEDYPWLAPAKGHATWNTRTVNVVGRSSMSNRNPSVYALGPGISNLKGLRGMVVADDLEGERERNSPVAAERLYQWVTMMALRMVEDVSDNPRRLFVNAGTPFFPDSLHFRLAKYHGFKMLRVPFRHPDGRLVWPAKRALVRELWHRWDDGGPIFKIAMELDPTGGREDMMSLDQLIELGRQRTVDPAAETWLKFICLDPASGSSGQRADYAGLSLNRLTWRVDEKWPRVETGAAWRVHGGIMDQLRLCNALKERHPDARIVIEGNATQEANYTHLIHEFFPHLLKFVDFVYTTEQKKNGFDDKLGIEAMIHMLREHYWTISTAEGERGLSEGKRTLFNEIKDFGRVKDDHILMSVWFCVRWAFERRQTSQVRQDQVTSRFPRPFGAGRRNAIGRLRRPNVPLRGIIGR